MPRPSSPETGAAPPSRPERFARRKPAVIDEPGPLVSHLHHQNGRANTSVTALPRTPATKAPGKPHHPQATPLENTAYISSGDSAESLRVRQVRTACGTNEAG